VGRFPWPRSVYGELVRELERQGARAIVMDVELYEPDRLRPEHFEPALREAMRRHRAELEVIAARLGAKAADRPLFRSLDEARALYDARLASYRLCDWILPLQGDEGVDAVAERIVGALNVPRKS